VPLNDYNGTYGPTWLRPTSFMPARFVKPCLPSAWLRPGKTPNLNAYRTGFMNW
jgi:hypothetical protein